MSTTPTPRYTTISVVSSFMLLTGRQIFTLHCLVRLHHHDAVVAREGISITALKSAFPAFSDLDYSQLHKIIRRLAHLGIVECVYDSNNILITGKPRMSVKLSRAYLTDVTSNPNSYAGMQYQFFLLKDVSLDNPTPGHSLKAPIPAPLARPSLPSTPARQPAPPTYLDPTTKLSIPESAHDSLQAFDLAMNEYNLTNDPDDLMTAYKAFRQFYHTLNDPNSPSSPPRPVPLSYAQWTDNGCPRPSLDIADQNRLPG